MNSVVNNILTNIPEKVPEEIFKTLLFNRAIKIEQIISQGHCSPLKQWYDQVQDEWVILLEGHAKLQFEGDLEPITLNSGDYLFIPAHTKHRVHWTHPEIKSIWLAIHLYPTESDHE